MSYESAIFQWDAGQRRLERAPAPDRAAMERVTERIVAELRRRLGGAFTTAELAELYSLGTEWCLQLAMATAPDRPTAWDTQTVADAAFARYVRQAVDFAGGRRVEA